MNTTTHPLRLPLFAGARGVLLPRMGLLLAAVLVLSACGGGGTDATPFSNPFTNPTPTPTPNPNPNPNPNPSPNPPGTSVPGKAARVEIVQTGLLFTEAGQTRQLEARVFDADGAPVNTRVLWSSSDATNISINARGLAVAERASGSSQITATVDQIRSAPLLAVVTTVAAGTVLVSDEQIVRGVVETDPEAEPSLDNTYTVVISGIAVPAVGTLLAGTGSAPVAGRVVAARQVTKGVEVTLKLAPIAELFPGLEINQRFDLAQVPATIPDSVTASHTVTRDGNTYTFTPRSESDAESKAAGGVPVGTRTLFQGCEGSVNGLGLGDGAAPPFVFEPQPAFTLTISPALDVLYTEARGLERFLVTAKPTFQIDGTVKATAAFEGKISCKAELLLFRVPVGGALSVLISGLVPVGVGFELGGKVTVAQLKIGFQSRTSAEAAVGVACDGECRFVNQLDNFVNTNTPTVDVPGEEDFRVAPELTAFGYVEANIGNPVFRSLQFKAFEIKAGPKLEGKFAPIASQIAATDFKSSYKLSLVINAGFGDDIEKVLNILGVVAVGDEVLEKGIDLAGSPTGVLTVDRDRFAAGDVVRFELKLDPATIAFLGLYNVSDIVLIRNSSGVREVARVAASSGQTTFNFTFIAPDAGQSNEFTAFVETTLLQAELLSLELDTARSDNIAPLAADDSASVLADSAASTLHVLDNDRDADGDTLRVLSVTQPGQGQVSIAADGTTVTYRPAAGFTGTETFGYVVTDDKGGSDDGRVTVEVRPAAVTTVRIDGTGITTSSSARACQESPSGNCEQRDSDSSQRSESAPAAITLSGNLSSSQSESLDSVSASAQGSTSYTITLTGDDVSQIDLSCSGAASASEPKPGIGSRAGGGSQSAIAFRIEGAATLRYQFAVTSSNASATPPNDSIANAYVSARLTSSSGQAIFSSTTYSVGSVPNEGSPTGTLRRGQYFINITCSTGTGPDEGEGSGSANSSGNVRLTLTP